MKKIILLAKMVGALCLIFLVLILGVYIKYRLELKDIQSLVEDYFGVKGEITHLTIDNPSVDI